MATFEVDIDGATYEVDAPDENTAWAWANQTHAGEKPKQSQYSLKNVIPNAIGLGKNLAAVSANYGDTLTNAMEKLPMSQLTTSLADYATDGKYTKAREQQKKAIADFKASREGERGYTGVKLVHDIAATAGAGDVLAIGAGAAKLNKLANALKSGGFNLGEKAVKGLPAKQAIVQALERGGTRVAGGALSGGAQAGMINPEDAGTGALIGGALPVAVKGAYGVGKGVTGAAKSLIDPLYEGGREAILGKALRNAAGNQSDDALRSLQNAQELVPGSQPTAGMVANNPGIAALERSAMANNPVATNELALRQAANSEARNSTLEGLIPNRKIAEQARTDATQALYNQSSTAPVKATMDMTQLLQRPSMQAAVQRASKLADEAGEVFDLNNMTGKSAQYIKMALDDMANSAPMTGIGGNELRSIQSTRQAYLDELGKQIPEYLEANKQYAELSAPLTQADVLGDIQKKATDFRGNFTPAAFARALSDKTAQSATGRANATLESTLNPSQLSVLENIKKDLLNQDYANTAGRGVGSNTVQNLANSNMVESFGIPTALRNSTVGGVVGGVLSRGGDVVYGKANKQLSQELAEALLDPKKAARIMEKASKPTVEGDKYKLLAKALSRSAPVLATHE